VVWDDSSQRFGCLSLSKNGDRDESIVPRSIGVVERTIDIINGVKERRKGAVEPGSRGAVAALIIVEG
jgi:hypothetical protein